MEEKIIERLMFLSKRAVSKSEIPVAAIIIKDGKIISEAYNKRYKNSLTLSHAEIIAINKANKVLRDWRLSGCDLYVTLKPCDMCKSIIKESRIGNVYYLVDPLDFKKSYNKTIEHNLGKTYPQRSEEYSKIISNFFSNKR